MINNKKTLITISILSLLVAGGTISTVMGQSNHSTALLPIAPIGEAQVKKLVEIYSGTNNLNYEQIVLKTENNRRYYEVDAYKDNMEYDFDVDAISGEIFNSEIKKNDNNKTETSQLQQFSNDTLIGEAKVKDIVISKTAKDNLIFTEIKLNQSDDYNGTKVYEINAHVNDVKYDININALTGEILKYEVENIVTNSTTTPISSPTEQMRQPSTQTHSNQNNQSVSNSSSQQSSLISQDRVKQIIANKTGKTNLIYTQIQLTRDDDYNNRLVYEVEAKLGTVEYEIDIDATNGTILKYEVD